MKNLFAFFRLALAISILFSACTIQKRQHLPGYHIAWNGSSHHKVQPKTPIGEEANALIQSPKLAVVVDTLETGVTAVDLGIAGTGPETSDKPSKAHRKPNEGASELQPPRFRSIESRIAPIDPEDSRVSHEVREPTATIALISAIGGWVMSLLSSTIFWIPYISFILIIIAFVLSIVAMSRIRRNNTEGFGAALAAFIISLLYLLLLVMLFIIILSLI